MKDFCSWFPENVWGVYIGDCCRIHDEGCSTSKFYECLSRKIDIFSSALIVGGGAIGCWIKYTSSMWRKI